MHFGAGPTEIVKGGFVPEIPDTGEMAPEVHQGTGVAVGGEAGKLYR